ncbi:ATP-binding cassette domain-containing protein [Nitriliruptor alkaliphilus]|uniref:ATP-binding cassette domain-containing protein n=1 Tax=Nitriliruptor alkaliphilus TaxID=427918 RepID=UPI000696C185|nr:ATP-binding cassette domain-containing protein [Nitriliruptor alkaliphilus]
MPSIHLRDLTFAHTLAATPLSHVTLDLAADPLAHGGSWVGVVGANGVGKSTLLRLLAGDLHPTGGDLVVRCDRPPRYVPQDAEDLDEATRAFAWDWDAPAASLRSRLELDPDDLDPATGRGWHALSPGQRGRWLVAAALADEPDVLLLDEPTNHLDVAARDLLVDALAEFRGLGLVVSHDRDLLERLTTRTLRVDRGAVTLHPGAYGEASARWSSDEAAQREQHARATREVRRQQRILGDVRRDRHGAEAKPRRERRLAGASQPDAREAGRKFAQQKAEAKLANRVMQLNARVERAEQHAVAVAEGIERDHTGGVEFRHADSGRRVLAAVHGVVEHGGGQPWLTGVDVALHRGERVHLAGANGAGKTTLLRALHRELASSSEQVVVLPQELDDPVAEVDAVRALDPTTKGRVLGTVATLGVDPERVLVTDAPSPGEARKLVLARMLAADGASVLVLDEPTNHLDLPSIERLEEALEGWPGALLLVTHDEALAAAVTTTRWEVADQRVVVSR